MKKSYKSTLIACYLGYITQAITVNLATLFFVIFNESYGISYDNIASLVLATFLIQLTVDAVMVKFTCVVGYRACAVAAHVFSFVGLVLFGILPHIMEPLTGIFIGMFFYALGGGMTEVVISPIVDSLPGDEKTSGMCLLHSFYSWGLVAVVLVSTILLKLVGDSLWYVIPFFWALLPLFNMFFFMRVPMVDIPPEAKGTPLKNYFKSPLMYAALLLMICGGAAEMAMSQWASLFAENGLGVTKVVGDLLGPCLFAVNMGIGRTLYGIFGERINIKKALLACSLLCCACYAVTVFVQAPIVALLGCSVCGLGVSLMWPGILSMTSASFGKNSSPALFAFLALAGDVGCSVGPWLTGHISSAYLATNTTASSGSAIRAGLFAASAFPMIMVIMCAAMLFVGRRKAEK